MEINSHDANDADASLLKICERPNLAFNLDHLYKFSFTVALTLATTQPVDRRTNCPCVPVVAAVRSTAILQHCSLPLGHCRVPTSTWHISVHYLPEKLEVEY
ncbi:unnamed protein product [Citrullus colocynthis]|uniref:Uncharacterized protein n=1 Tax=Citrullus colocynthis TaxID=252529 RepID=A0ABP0Z4S3_9ROSI